MLQRDRTLVAKFLDDSVLDSGLGPVVLPLTRVFASLLKERVYVDSSIDQCACNVFQHVFRPFDPHARLCKENLRTRTNVSVGGGASFVQQQTVYQSSLDSAGRLREKSERTPVRVQTCPRGGLAAGA